MTAASIDANSGTTRVREGYAFDEEALSRWMSLHISGFEGPLQVEQFRGGQSNPTYKWTTRTASYVLRRKPVGQILKGAHAIEREATVLIALGKAGFPVAKVHALCTDDSVLGTWFYIMDMVEGRIFWDAAIPDVGTAERARHFDAMNATIAQLHKFDAVEIGLGDYGKPGNYYERQINRWSLQYLEDTHAGRDPNMDRMV